MNKSIIEKIKEAEIGKVEENVYIRQLTTYQVGGRADLVAYPKDTESLIRLLKIVRTQKVPYKILGNGSNLLFSDRPFEGVLIKLDQFDDLRFVRHNVVVGAGYPLMKLVVQAVRKDLSGLEFAAGIPGTVGGAVFMNAGAYKSDMGYIVKECKVLTADYKVITLTNAELAFHYRTSYLQKHKNVICLEVTLHLKKGDKKEMESLLRDRRTRRLESQPLEFPSAGSVFRNPEGLFAGKMIEDLGLKGLMRGGAQISEKHANFIINANHAKAQDVKDLIDFVKTMVKEKYEIDLKVEQEFVNWE